MPDLLDVSVWLPLSAPDHVHHHRALRYWNKESDDELIFCRVTALALLRHLTNKSILGKRVLNSLGAWRALELWFETDRVRYVNESTGLDEHLARYGAQLNLQGGSWTDAYLAAFAASANFRLVAFDGDFQRYNNITFLHLQD